ncbi:phage major capsid protein [Streptomyces collinus]|uniref:phage major capsid protein n=1 Tax=Streptomyces collinus TaxID=42684 RepID=UPI0033EFC6F4
MTRKKGTVNDYPPIDRMTSDEIQGRMADLHAEAEGREFNEYEQSEWDALEARYEENERRRELVRQHADNPRHREAAGPLVVDRGDGPRDAAMRNLDAAVKGGTMPADAAEKVERLMSGRQHGSLAARWAAAGSEPAYVSAFFKALSGERGHLLWTPEEADAYRRVEAVRAELRAMQVGAGATGGFQIPTVIDPALRISSDGSISPIRQLAEVRQEIGTEFKPVTSAHVTNQWTAESVQVPDNSPTLEQSTIKSFKSTSFVPFSFEYETASFGGAIQDLTRLLVDGYDQLSNEAFLNGNGTTQPQGLWTGLGGTASELSPAAAETFNAAVDVYAVQNALPPRFQPGASWLMDLATINKISESETTNGAPRFPNIGETNPVLLRKPVGEWSNMRSSADITPTVTADNPIIIYGDIRQTYCIVDFAGSSVELVPHLVGDNHRPTGERGLLLWARVGAGVVIANAARVLNVATTA